MLLLLVACAPQTVQRGDTVTFDYIGTLDNGTVFDTSLSSAALAAGISKKTYSPLTVTIGEGKIIPGLEEGLIGMKKGETKTVTIQPSKAYGERSDTKVVLIPLEESMPRMAEANNTGANVTIGQIVKLRSAPWTGVITKVTPTTLTIRQNPENGMVINTSFGPARVTVGDENLTVHLLLEEGGILRTPNGNGRVIAVNATRATLDFNHPLAGEALTFTVTMRSIEKKASP